MLTLCKRLLVITLTIAMLSVPTTSAIANDDFVATQIPSSNKETEPQKAAAAVAGVYFIPGIGQVALLATGAIVVGGAVFAAGSWIYQKVHAYLAAEAYEEAKEDGTKTENHSKKIGTSLPTTSDSYSSKDLYKDGKLVQRRYYDKDGRVDMDIDYTNHGNPKAHPKVPHRHDWTWQNGRPSRGSWY